MNDRNPFGGLNANSLYVPMSETEMEFLDLLIGSRDLHVDIIGWGTVYAPRVIHGDHQLVVPLDITFDRPEVPISVASLTLALRTGSGLELFRQEQSTIYEGAPLQICSGFNLSMVWHIGIRAIDPNLIRTIMPNAHGLTSRNLDKDTGAVTVEGNMKLPEQTRRLLHSLRAAEARIRNSH